MNGSITFNAGGFEMLRLCDNGDIFVKTKLCTSDKETVRNFKRWLDEASTEFGDGSICRERTIAERHDKI